MYSICSLVIRKANDLKKTAVVTAVAKLLNIYNRELNWVQKVNGMPPMSYIL